MKFLSALVAVVACATVRSLVSLIWASFFDTIHSIEFVVIWRDFFQKESYWYFYYVQVLSAPVDNEKVKEMAAKLSETYNCFLKVENEHLLTTEYAKEWNELRSYMSLMFSYYVRQCAEKKDTTDFLV